MKIRQGLRNPDVKDRSSRRHVAIGILLPTVCAFAVGACGKANTVGAAPIDTDTSVAASTTTTSTTEQPTTTTTAPVPSTKLAPVEVPPSPVVTTTKKPAPTKPSKCTGFKVEKAPHGGKKVTALVTGALASGPNVVTVVETFDFGESLGSAKGLSVTAVPQYAGDLVLGGQAENPQILVTVGDYAGVPGGLGGSKLPTTNADFPDSAKAYRC